MLLFCLFILSASAQDKKLRKLPQSPPPPGGIKLLDGYVHILLPEQTRGKFVGFQIAIDAVVVKVFKMLRQICASIIDLAGEQILTIKLACCFHASNFNQIYTFEKVLIKLV
jgi:hypothetical protein